MSGEVVDIRQQLMESAADRLREQSVELQALRVQLGTERILCDMFQDEVADLKAKIASLEGTLEAVRRTLESAKAGFEERGLVIKQLAAEASQLKQQQAQIH